LRITARRSGWPAETPHFCKKEWFGRQFTPALALPAAPLYYFNEKPLTFLPCLIIVPMVDY
jgi:hypothetical protein